MKKAIALLMGVLAAVFVGAPSASATINPDPAPYWFTSSYWDPNTGDAGAWVYQAGSGDQNIVETRSYGSCSTDHLVIHADIILSIIVDGSHVTTLTSGQVYLQNCNTFEVVQNVGPSSIQMRNWTSGSSSNPDSRQNTAYWSCSAYPCQLPAHVGRTGTGLATDGLGDYPCNPVERPHLSWDVLFNGQHYTNDFYGVRSSPTFGQTCYV